MELSPQTIRSVDFKIVKKGYDPDQVDSFKDDVASVVEAANHQATAMEARARAAVAKLHEVSQHAPAVERSAESFSASDNDVITRTLALAQRTADAAVAEARAEADSIMSKSRDEAERLLEDARTLATKTIEDSRTEARRAVEGDRVQAENELQSLLARRDFLLSDVDHLEQHLQAQRERLRDAASALQELVERVPAGLGEIRRPLLSASAAPVSGVGAKEPKDVDDDVALNDDDDLDDNYGAGVADGTEVALFDDADGDDKEELSELVWDDTSIAAAERAPTNLRRGNQASAPFDDSMDADSVWRILDDEVAGSHAQAGLFPDDITTEVPIIPRVTDTFRVGGDELQ